MAKYLLRRLANYLALVTVAVTLSYFLAATVLALGPTSRDATHRPPKPLWTGPSTS